MNSTTEESLHHDDEPVELVLSEEQLDVARPARAAQRVRVSKRVVTEYVTQTVPVRREELVVEYEDIDPGSTPDLPGIPAPAPGFDLVLREERVTVSTEVVEVERVHVSVTTVTDGTTVSADLRREQVDLQTDGSPRPA